jgi:2-amino-4-hydroxy-6-hydroxymethyldihydropteridine diphosphokinase
LNAPGQTAPEAVQHQHQVCLLLGSNIQPERNLRLALGLLASHLTIIRASSVWESAAVGSSGANFLNAALLCLTPLDAEGLKWLVLRPLEAQLGRVRNSDKNAPRPIDLDIMTVDGGIYDPLLWQYSFRAVPVAEILPDLTSDTGESLAEAGDRLRAELPLRLRNDIMLMDR